MNEKKHNVDLVAHKWWKVWSAAPLTEKEKVDLHKDLEKYNLNFFDVVAEMTKIFQKYNYN